VIWKNIRKLYSVSPQLGKTPGSRSSTNNDWSKFFPAVSSFNFSGKRVAIFGLGDHITYAYHFVDSMGLLGRLIKNQGGEIFGNVSTDGYTFQDSDAILGGNFIGLPVDEDFEPELTEERVSAWVNKLMKEF
jgi:flavodoxin I